MKVPALQIDRGAGRLPRGMPRGSSVRERAVESGAWLAGPICNGVERTDALDKGHGSGPGFSGFGGSVCSSAIRIEIAQLDALGQKRLEPEDVHRRCPTALHPSLDLLVDGHASQLLRESCGAVMGGDQSADGGRLWRFHKAVAYTTKTCSATFSCGAGGDVTSICCADNRRMTETIGARIKRLALEIHGMSLADLAKELDVSYETTRKWVQGHTAPNRRRTHQLAVFLGVTPDMVTYGEVAGLVKGEQAKDETALQADHAMVFGLLSLEDQADVHALAVALVMEKHPNLAKLMDQAGVSRRADDARVAEWKAKIDKGAFALPTRSGKPAPEKQLHKGSNSPRKRAHK